MRVKKARGKAQVGDSNEPSFWGRQDSANNDKE